MKPHEETIKKIISQWIFKADLDYNLAEDILSRGQFLSAIGYHAQQAAEKYLKALLTLREIDFPKTHSIAHLLELISSSDPDLAVRLADAAILTPYGADIRYPGDLPELSLAEAQRAVELARSVRDSIKSAIEKTS